MEKEKIEKHIEEIEHLVEDVNQIEISSHFWCENLPQWINAWQNAMKQRINKIKEEL